ncbi:hypothetical protein Btru_046623 [Bulinus truncatus]|nr:hypothetical protein Btru_046623 [Bulinus truncatus]
MASPSYARGTQFASFSSISSAVGTCNRFQLFTQHLNTTVQLQKTNNYKDTINATQIVSLIVPQDNGYYYIQGEANRPLQLKKYCSNPLYCVMPLVSLQLWRKQYDIVVLGQSETIYILTAATDVYNVNENRTKSRINISCTGIIGNKYYGCNFILNEGVYHIITGNGNETFAAISQSLNQNNDSSCFPLGVSVDYMNIPIPYAIGAKRNISLSSSPVMTSLLSTIIESSSLRILHHVRTSTFSGTIGSTSLQTSTFSGTIGSTSLQTSTFSGTIGSTSLQTSHPTLGSVSTSQLASLDTSSYVDLSTLSDVSISESLAVTVASSSSESAVMTGAFVTSSAMVSNDVSSAIIISSGAVGASFRSSSDIPPTSSLTTYKQQASLSLTSKPVLATSSGVTSDPKTNLHMATSPPATFYVTPAQMTFSIDVTSGSISSLSMTSREMTLLDSTHSSFLTPTLTHTTTFTITAHQMTPTVGYTPLKSTTNKNTLPPNPSSSPKKLSLLCPCSPRSFSNTMLSAEQLAVAKDAIRTSLVVNKSQISSFVREKSSSQDSRPRAAAIGTAGVVVIAGFIGVFLLPDVLALASWASVVIAKLAGGIQK